MDLTLSSENLKMSSVQIGMADFAKICRFCLSEEDIYPIFESCYEETKVIHLLTSCIKVKVKEKDQLPQNICSICLGDLIMAYSFQQKCITNNEVLHSVLRNENKLVCKQADNAESRVGTSEGTGKKTYKGALINKNVQKGDMLDVIIREEDKDLSQESNEMDVTKTELESQVDETEFEDNKSFECIKNSQDIQNNEDSKNIQGTEIFQDIKNIEETENVDKRKKPKKDNIDPVCPICDLSFETKVDLQEHRINAHQTCTECNRSWRCEYKFKTHMRTHTKEKPYMCSDCGKCFSQVQNLRRHIMTHTGERPYTCHICAKGFIQLTALKDHMRVHEMIPRERRYNISTSFFCEHCGRLFKKLHFYEKHIQHRHPEHYQGVTKPDVVQNDDFKCKYCARTFKMFHFYQSHIKTEHPEYYREEEFRPEYYESTGRINEEGKNMQDVGEKNVEIKDADIEGVEIKDDVKDDMEEMELKIINLLNKQMVSKDGTIVINQATDKMEIETDNSQNKTSNGEIFNKATAQKTVNKPQYSEGTSANRFQCVVCKRHMKSSHRLKAHMITHGDKTHFCPHCGKGFYSIWACQIHQRIHTDETPFHCDRCGKTFKFQSSLEVHLLIHQGARPFSCKQCPKTFVQQGHLNSHVVSVHQKEKAHVCKFCNKPFALKGNLKVHMRTHTGETPYECNVCNKGFHDSSSLKRHMKVVHGTIFKNENRAGDNASGSR